MTKDITEQNPCSNEHLLKVIKPFFENIMAATLELDECLEKLCMHIVHLNKKMDNLCAKSLDINKEITSDDI